MTLTLRGSDQSVTVPLVEQPDGSWRTDVLHLPHGYGIYVASYNALNGDVPLAQPFSHLLNCVKLPVLADVAVSPDPASSLTFGHEAVGVSGRLTTYDPSSEYNDAAFTDATQLQLLGAGKLWAQASPGADGSFGFIAGLPYTGTPATYTVQPSTPDTG